MDNTSPDKSIISPNSYRPISPPPELPPTRQLSKKISLSFLKITGHAPAQSTIVHREKSKGRPSPGSVDCGIIELTPGESASPEVSTSSGETSGNSGKSSNIPARTNSTGKTSAESKYSALAKVASCQSQNSGDKKTTVLMDPVPEAPLEALLIPIQEQETLPEPQPSKSPRIQKMQNLQSLVWTPGNELTGC